MANSTALFRTQLRHELAARNRVYARGRAHVESYGSAPVIVYAPEGSRHGNFFNPAYAAIAERPDWMRRFDKVHAQAARSCQNRKSILPGAGALDSSMSSDALLMNIFCTPGVVESAALRNALGIEDGAAPVFGWKARVPLANGRFDRTEVNLRLGSLLVEAKLTEADFQSRAAVIVEAYRDLDSVFDRNLLPRAAIPTTRWMRASEFPENESQEFESVIGNPALSSAVDTLFRAPGEPGYAGYQLIRNVLAAYAADSSFCVFHDARRPDLGEQWFQVLAAVKSAAMRVRLKILTWQELAALLPAALQDFLDRKYGIVAPGKMPSSIEDHL